LFLNIYLHFLLYGIQLLFLLVKNLSEHHHMNRFRLLITTVCVVLISACKPAAEAEEAKAVNPSATSKVKPATGVFYKVAPESRVYWIGSKPTGKHEGYFSLKAGELALKDNQIVGGHFAIDVHSLIVTDIKDEAKNKDLKDHLLSEDFFDAAQFGISRFVLVKTEPLSAGAEVKLAGATHNVTGNLSIKGKEQSITFPAIIGITDETITAKADFTINRSEFGMSYGADKSLKDRFILPEVKIRLDIKAQKDALATATSHSN